MQPIATAEQEGMCLSNSCAQVPVSLGLGKASSMARIGKDGRAAMRQTKGLATVAPATPAVWVCGRSARLSRHVGHVR